MSQTRHTLRCASLLMLAVICGYLFAAPTAQAEGEYWSPLQHKLTQMVRDRCSRVNQSPTFPGYRDASLQEMRATLIQLAETGYALSEGGTEAALTYADPEQLDE